MKYLLILASLLISSSGYAFVGQPSLIVCEVFGQTFSLSLDSIQFRDLQPLVHDEQDYNLCSARPLKKIPFNAKFSQLFLEEIFGECKDTPDKTTIFTGRQFYLSYLEDSGYKVSIMVETPESRMATVMIAGRDINDLFEGECRVKNLHETLL